MATAARRLPHNAPGDFFVDATCIDCDTCRWMAPATFMRREEQASVHTQPTSDADTRRALQALVSCPTASIGTTGPHDVRAAAASFPDPIADGVFHCGYHSESSFGAASYLVVRPEGNVLVDLPRFAKPLVKRIEELGGVATMFLTHRDDVADHAKFHAHFGCERVIHADDADAAQVERTIAGLDAVSIAQDLVVVPVPGHTAGSACLLWRGEFLFTGDHLAWSERLGNLYAFRDACWFDWRTQVELMRRLAGFDFEWVLPGHGRRAHFAKDEMRRRMTRCVAWMESLVTSKSRAVATLIVLLLVAAAFYGFSRSSTSTDRDVAKSNASATPGPRDARRTRGANASPDEASENADTLSSSTDEPAEDPAKWPIRVTTNVPGAKVALQLHLYGAGPDPAPETKTADAKGFVGFAAPAKDVAVRRFEFVARADGWATTREHLDQPGDVRIDLPRGVAVRGVVRDAAGKPTEDASIGPPSGAKWCGEETPKTGVDGTFEAFVEQPGAVAFQISHPAFLPRDVADDAPAAGLVVVLDRGLEVSGRVAFPDGRPLPGVGIFDAGGLARASTDGDGRYVVSGVARGPVTLQCNIAELTRTVEAGATGVDFVMKRSVARVRFLDGEGRPFRSPGMSLRVVKDGAVLDMSAGEGPSDGVDFADGPAGAQILVSAWGAPGQTGSGSTTFDAEPRLHDVDVVIGAARPTGTVRLIVRDESLEYPKAVYVSIDDDMGSTVAGDGRKRCDLDAAGAVEIPNVPAGHGEITVEAAAHWSGESLDTLLVTARTEVVVEVGRTTEVHTTLVVGGRVRATVRDEDGKAVTPDVVRLLTSTNGRMLDMFVRRNPEGGWTTELDTSPSVLLDAVKPGRYVVQTTGPAGDEVKKEIDVVRGETADVVLTVKAKR